ncbi:MAG: hypothetical protein LKF75_01245 [Bacilli bacterium]|jgi:hypothetical protein|nr:hypothetical protein [Bacilli bacterium]MCH4210607.1 hypothetical protein [Bacilli bacterium]MCH4228322.1 hypothetical protein [Bacilli bacterium]MCH4277862.1 hypothetical protein [Bacilli bacterium]MCI2055106.1 hypothetical protein [Bacilli bacterium]
MKEEFSFKIYYAALFLAMEALWDPNKEEEIKQNTPLNETLSEMDPFETFFRGLSPDPAYAYDYRLGFRRRFHSDCCSLEKGYSYSLVYLRTLDLMEGHLDPVLALIPDCGHFRKYVDEALKSEDYLLARTVGAVGPLWIKDAGRAKVKADRERDMLLLHERLRKSPGESLSVVTFDGAKLVVGFSAFHTGGNGLAKGDPGYETLSFLLFRIIKMISDPTRSYEAGELYEFDYLTYPLNIEFLATRKNGGNPK